MKKFALNHMSKTVIAIIVAASLVVVLVFFHLVTLIGIVVAGTIAYGLDHSIGVAINNRRFEVPPAFEAQTGLFLYRRDWYTRIKFVFWTFVIWFGVGLALGRYGLTNIMEIPAQMAAFIVGIMLGPWGFSLWQKRRELAAHADRLQKGLDDGTINPADLVRHAATTVGASVTAAVAEVVKTSGNESGDGGVRTTEGTSVPPAPQPVGSPRGMSAKDILQRHADGRKL